MTLIVAFVSQKGGVGKSTLARGLARMACAKGWLPKSLIWMLSRSVVVWETTRARHSIEPSIEVGTAAGVKDAVKNAGKCDLLILDTAGKVTDGTTEAAGTAHLLVQPTSPTSDDLHISVLVSLAMERIGLPRERLAFALTRVLSEAEEK